MELKNFVLGIFQDGKQPEEFDNIKPIKTLEEVRDYMTLYFVDRDAATVSALRIEKFFYIDDEKGGVIEGEWELGGYNLKEKCYYPMGKHPISHRRPSQTFLAQERLDTDEVYALDHIPETLKERKNLDP